MTQRQAGNIKKYRTKQEKLTLKRGQAERQRSDGQAGDHAEKVREAEQKGCKAKTEENIW